MVDQTEIHRRAQNKNMEERKRAVEELKINFAILNDKEQAWDDLHMLTQDNKDDVRIGAANAFGSCYPHILEAYKNQAWDDLHMLTQDNKDDVRIGAANALGSCYPHIPEECKNQALDDLHMLTQDNNEDVRIGATNALSSCYPHIPEKHKKQKQAWNDLYRLTQDKDSDVRRIAADVLVSSYFLFSKKYKDYAWNDLHMLTQDKDGNVRKIVADALSSSYSQIPEQYIKQAWNDLHRLTQDKNNYVRRSAADALGSCYSQIPEKYRKHTCDDLHMLTQDKDANVRISANHSSGRVSIYRASQAKGDESVRTELERALRFFEKSSKESTYFNPAKFCLPFYRSFYTITFKKESAEDEVKKYFAEAKEAVKGSESKEKLLEAVENLGNALKEVQKARNLDAIKSDLNAYRQYCDRACELLDTTEERAPGASGLIRKGLPIIDKKIKEMLKEIEEKTRQFCQESRQTPFEKISRNTYYQVKGLGEVDSQDEAETRLNNLRSLLQSMCSILPEESMKLIRRQLDEIKDAKLSDKVKILENTLISIAVGIKNLEYRSTEQKKEIDYFKDLVIRRLDNINYGVFQLKLRSGEMAPALWNIKYELNRIQTDFTNFGINLEDVRNLQHQSIQHLNDKMTKLASEIETKVVIELPKTYETQKILDELKIFNQCIQKSKPCTSEVWFNRMAGLASIIGGILTILPKG